MGIEFSLPFFSLCCSERWFWREKGAEGAELAPFLLLWGCPKLARGERLKKKEEKNGGSKRNKSWTEKFTKKKKSKAREKKKKAKPQHEESESFVRELQRHEKNTELSGLPALLFFTTYYGMPALLFLTSKLDSEIFSLHLLFQSSNFQSVSNLQSFEGPDGWQF